MFNPLTIKNSFNSDTTETYKEKLVKSIRQCYTPYKTSQSLYFFI